jgi:hypothetical protein
MTLILKYNLHKLLLRIAVTFRSNGYNKHSLAACFFRMKFGFTDERLDLHMPVKFELCISNPSGAMTGQSWQNMEKNSILDHVWQSISLQSIDLSRWYSVSKLGATYCICLPNVGPVSFRVLAPWGAKMCRNLRLLCRYAEMSISDYVLGLQIFVSNRDILKIFSSSNKIQILYTEVKCHPYSWHRSYSKVILT